ncbi:MAG: NAD(P)/FAD-dependent oxidoreductase [Nitrospirae bacterium]|nr:NAD(P)/FAD-dependent oxidoreductase [Nitrospirota bacterium]
MEVKPKIVIVGGGIAGVSAAEAARKASAKAKIIMLSKEPYLPYYRINLTRYLAGEVTNNELEIHPESWYKGRDIDLSLGTELSSIDLASKALVMRDGKSQTYDKLILTLGSYAYVPPIAGIDKPNVIVLRTRDDADCLLNNCQRASRFVCIGGGLLGLETAGALSRRGMEVALLEGFNWLLPRQLNRKASAILERHITKEGFTIHKGVKTKEIVGDENSTSVLLDNGNTIAADMIIVTTGIRSNIDLARAAGLSVNNGIIVDNTLKTSHPDVYAAGDVAEHKGIIYGTWGSSMTQGTTAGMNAAGQHVEFTGIPRSNMLKVLGYDMFSIGEIDPAIGSDEVIDGEMDGNYYYFLLRGNHLIGAILLGDIRPSVVVRKTLEKQVDCSEVLKAKKGVLEVLSFFKDAVKR